jgi:hypothetical protein
MYNNSLSFGPHVEGVIRIEAAPGADAEGKSKLVFQGSMEVHARVHEAAEEGASPKHQAHPITQKLMELPANEGTGKLKEIPIKLFFNKAQNALQSRYQAYDMSSGIPVCSGDGKTAVRHMRMELSRDASDKVECRGPEVCDFALAGHATCRRQVTMAVQIQGQDDPLSVFQLRSSSYYTHKALSGQLALIEKRFNGLRHVPLKLQLWESSTRRSGYEAFDLFKLALDASSEIEAMASAKTAREAEVAAGLDSSVDEVYAPSEDEALNRAGDEFDLAETFYQERDGSPGALSGKAIGKKPAPDNNLASSLLTSTLNVARGAAATHNEPEKAAS